MRPDDVSLNKAYNLGTPAAEAARLEARRRRRRDADLALLTRDLLRAARLREARLDRRRTPVEPMS